MRMKRMIAWMICAVMLLAMIPAGILTAGAGGTEGDWTTYRSAGDYPDPNEPEDPWEEERIYKPEAGYHYTDEGFSTIAPSYEETCPFMTVSTKEKQSIKDGIYLEFRVDNYSYDGGMGADEWICLTLTTGHEGTGKVVPGSTAYGGGWMTLIRGTGNGSCHIMPHLTDPKTEDFNGTFVNAGMVDADVPMDDMGREIYTFEVVWNGSEYIMKLNGVELPDHLAQTTKLLNKLSADGEFFVGITMQSQVKDGTADLTILKYGTSKADATTPVGTDSKEPEENLFVIADIADPDTVPTNQPAILWSPETYDMRNWENISFAVQGDNTWHATVSGSVTSWNFKPKNSWSYAAEDFPVFGILLRDIWADSGTLWYSAGEYKWAIDGMNVPFSIYDGACFEDSSGAEYFFIPIDLADLWEGRINNIRLDFAMSDPDNREFDICFAGMFRSEGEAYAYAEEYLVERGVPVESVSETDPVVEPDPGWPDSQYPETQAPAPIDPETKAPESENSQPGNSETETLNDVEFIMTTLGCTGSVGGGAVLMLLIGAALLKKKED